MLRSKKRTHFVGQRFMRCPAKHGCLKGVGNRRLLVIGDVHGCVEEARDLLKLCEHDRKQDVVIFVGDLVNKGPDSLGALRLARDIGAHCVFGNHEDNVLRAHRDWIRGKKKIKKSLEYVKKLSEKDLRYLNAMPHTLNVPTHGILVVHAGFVPNVSISKQKPKDMCRMRDVYVDEEGIMHASIKSCEQGVPWASLWNGPEHVVYGHDAIRRLQIHPHATGIDTGCCYGDRLTACIVQPRVEEEKVGQMRLVSVPAREAYCMT